MERKLVISLAANKRVYMNEPTKRMSIKTVLKYPDSYKKFIVLEYLLMKSHFHGDDWCKGKEEWERLYCIYNDERMKKWKLIK